MKHFAKKILVVFNNETMKQLVFKSLFLFISLLLIINVFYSQLISPLYFNFVNNDEASTVSFLKKIKNLPDYKKILEMNNNIFGETVNVEIFRQENLKKDMINDLEQQLTINPKSRDILYSLYKLYLAEGDKGKAGEYLRKAREIDPAIGL